VVLANNRVNSLWTFFWPLITFLNSLGVFVVWACGVWLIGRREPEFDVGSLTAFVVLSGMFYGKLEMMSRMVNASQRAANSAQRIFEILDRVSSVPEPARPIAVDKLRGDLEFRHVGFRYGNRKVIKDFSLKIAAGEMIGLVGHTGAGKSTLINLVCRFFDVAEGAILADGVDIRSYKIEQYRRNVGIVLQDPFLFYGTIAENIAYGLPGATREQIINAAKAARAHEFILQLADGYDSLVGERGQSLSGGERQRISIARALLIDPRILILDEATSALDSTTERQIQEALQNLVRGRTTIAIAHRLSTLRQANRIMVIERGRLVEIGTHDELLAMQGAYAELHRAQQISGGDRGLGDLQSTIETIASNDAMGDLVKIDFSELRFSRNEWGQLVLSLPGGVEHHGVEPVRCFPLTDPSGAIALLDTEGRELFNLPGFDVLDPSARDALQRELIEREFMPVIRRIITTSTANPPCRWEVDTDRGQTGFQLESEDDVRRLGPKGAIVADSNGIRYKIPDIDELDASSQRIIRRLV
jgi:ATP-binding cassette subfamily B protein